MNDQIVHINSFKAHQLLQFISWRNKTRFKEMQLNRNVGNWRRLAIAHLHGYTHFGRLDVIEKDQYT